MMSDGDLTIFDDEHTNEVIHRQVSGIYQIRNLHTGRVYIGKSRNILTRWIAHRGALNRGLHINDALQGDWEIFGSGAFEFTILEEVTGLPALHNAEARHLAAASNAYNVLGVLEFKEPERQPTRPTSPEEFIYLMFEAPAWEMYCRILLSDGESVRVEWRQRGAEEGREFALLTDTLNQGAFDLTTSEHRQVKRLSSRQNLRDSMTPLELVLTSLAEVTATTMHQAHDSQGFTELRHDAHEAGDVAGSARRDIEARLGQPVVSPVNYKPLRQKRWRELQPHLMDEYDGVE